MLGEKRALKLAGEAGNARIVRRVAPLAPLRDAVGIGRVPVAVQLPMHVFEPHINEV